MCSLVSLTFSERAADDKNGSFCCSDLLNAALIIETLEISIRVCDVNSLQWSLEDVDFQRTRRKKIWIEIFTRCLLVIWSCIFHIHLTQLGTNYPLPPEKLKRKMQICKISWIKARCALARLQLHLHVSSGAWMITATAILWASY